MSNQKEEPRSTRNEMLGCRFLAWRVISDNELALEMPPGNRCDMTGAIEIATKIMPNVQRIATYDGTEADTEYRRVLGRWLAYLAEGRS